MPPAKLGLIYSHTGIRRFIDLIGLARTRELFLVGRNIPADRALAWGMVNELAGRDDLPRVSVELAAEVASLAPLAQRGNKSIIRALIAAEAHLDADTERMLVDLRRACFDSEDFHEGVSAFGERRPPRWQGR
jgi:enoyl-CoA hydratase/carnithine racemase